MSARNIAFNLSENVLRREQLFTNKIYCINRMQYQWGHMNIVQLNRYSKDGIAYESYAFSRPIDCRMFDDGT